MKESGKKRTHADRQRLLTQIFCIVLAALMLLGVLAAILPYAMMQAYAADEPAVTAEDTDADAAEEPDNGLPLRIGLMFGSDVTPSFDISTACGFTFGSVDDETDCYTPYFTAVKPAVSICQDTNLTYSTDESKNRNHNLTGRLLLFLRNAQKLIQFIIFNIGFFNNCS